MGKSSALYTIKSPAQLVLFPAKQVRWLSIAEDYAMIAQYFRLFNADIASTERDTMYFCIDVRQYGDAPQAKGRLCAWIENGQILSFGGVDYVSQDTWEIVAGSTHPKHTGKGYSKAVCSFLAQYILENGKQAICETNKQNLAAMRVLQGIGMMQS